MSLIEAANAIKPYKHEADKLVSAIARSSGRNNNDPNRFDVANRLYNELVSKIVETVPPQGAPSGEREASIGTMDVAEAEGMVQQLLKRRNPLYYARKTRLSQSALESEMSRFKEVDSDWYTETMGVLENFDDFVSGKSPDFRRPQSIYGKEEVEKIILPRRSRMPSGRIPIRPMPSGI